MIRQIAAFSVGGHKVHCGVGASHGEAADRLGQPDMFQMGLADKGQAVALADQLRARADVAGLQFDVGLDLVLFKETVHDLAGALTFIEDREDVPDLVNAWLDGYRKVLPFTDTDFVEIDTFILQRRIQMMAWMGSHQDSTPVQGYMQGYMEGTMNLVERYLRLFG